MMTTAMTTVERQLASHRSKHLSSLRPNRNLATIQLFNARLLSSPHQIAMIHDQRFLLLFLGFGREDTKIPHSLQHHFISALALQERTTSDRDTLEACEKWLVPVQRVSGRRVTRNTPTREKKKHHQSTLYCVSACFSPFALPGCCIAKFTGRENTIEWIYGNG